MSARRLPFACTALAPLLLAPAIQAAPGDATRLEYARSAAAQACPDRAALREAVTKRLGYDPFFSVARQAVVVEITDDGEALSAAMRLLDESGIIRGGQQLHAPREHCDELVAALALAISIALDPSSALETPASPEPPAKADDEEPTARDVAKPKVEQRAPSAQPAPVAPHSVRAPTPTLPRAESVHFAARAKGFVATGTAPAPAAGVMLGVSARRAFLSLGVELGGQLPTSATVAGGGRARASELAAELSPCVVFGVFGGCGLAKLSSLRTEGVGVENPQRQSTLQFGLGVRAELAPRLSQHFSLLLSAELLKPLLPVTLRLRDENVWHSPVVSAAFGLGLSFEFS